MPTNHYLVKTAKQLSLASNAMKTGASTRIAAHNAILKMSQNHLTDWPFKWWTQSEFIAKILLAASMGKIWPMENTSAIIPNA